MDLSFFWTEVSLQFKKQEKEKRNPGKEKKIREKEKRNTRRALRRRDLPVCFPVFFREERGGKRRGKLRKKGIKWKEKRDKMEGKKGSSERKCWNVLVRCLGSAAGAAGS